MPIFNGHRYKNVIDVSWAAFLTYANIKFIYKAEDIHYMDSTDDGAQKLFTPTFVLPEYHGGIYMVVDPPTVFYAYDILRAMQQPCWVVTTRPSHQVSTLYYVGEFGKVVSIKVIPELNKAHQEKKLFTQPSQVDKDGFILPDTMKRWGKYLTEAIDYANAVVIDYEKWSTNPVDSAIPTPPTTTILTRVKQWHFVNNSVKVSFIKDGENSIKLEVLIGNSKVIDEDLPSDMFTL